MSDLLRTIFIVLLLLPLTNTAQNSKNGNGELIKLFIDCDHCDMTYFREEITFVNHVRDRKDADVHLLILDEDTGSGTQFILNFIGIGQFANINDTLYVTISEIDTDDDERKKIVQKIKLGLIQFISNSPLADHIELVFNGNNEDQQTQAIAQSDEWDNWVFQVELDSYFDGEESQSFYNLSSSFSANRVTDDWKLQAAFRNSYNESNFEYNDTNIKNISRRRNLFLTAIHSISNHWSLAYWFYNWTSTYSNEKMIFSTGPGIEYSFFPYTESSSRALKLQYRIFLRHNDYFEETIFFKTKELYVKQEVELILEYNQPWGSIDVALEYQNSFSDFEHNRLQAFADFEIKLVKGLAVNFDVGISRIHDQISLAKGNASIDEVLLQRRELETEFEYWGSFGFSYTFGSIYNNIVNTRFNN
ncbi:MAG: hypothetical protein K9J16_04780 [Melioribacteraceae bacterium]|nr:hypothetical protein [Melioribacteraceae bacterium]MCF8392805.1 hypothetical protein [Melioribacteraceae bacterium]MCF8418709.1 hypothetical protein [Melioribacteraceae bacterium]